MKVQNTLTIAASALLLQACVNSSLIESPTKRVEICAPHQKDTSTNKPIQFRQESAYTVKQDDTLWSVADHFLLAPWRWKEVWHLNKHIQEPNLIYPGDVLGVVSINGEKKITLKQRHNVYHGKNTGVHAKNGLEVYKYSPQISVEEREVPPLLIMGDMLSPFIMKTKVLSAGELERLPFIIADQSGYLSLSNQAVVYTQSLPRGKVYDIYRTAERLVDPNWNGLGGQKKAYHDSSKLMYEMIFVGQAELIGQDDETGLYKLEVTKLNQPLQEQDVLFPAEADNEPMQQYFPRAAADCIQGYMLRNANHQTHIIKQYDTVFTAFDEDNHANVGDIWKIVRKNPDRKINGQIVKIPSAELGYLMIIKVYEKYSLGLVIESKDVIHENDTLVRP